MSEIRHVNVTDAAVNALARAAASLAVCQRPAGGAATNSSPDELASSLSELVSSAELFGCRPVFWKWAADAADALGRSAEAQAYRQRLAAAAED
jgi:hypothetical protein